MAVQKNFVVKNGLEVDNNLIFADAINNKVGIGTTILTDYQLHVNGGIGATTLNVVGVSTFSQISAGGTTGSSDQFLVSTGIGLTWKTIPTRTSVTYVATLGQTSFAFTYNVGLVDVYVNGVRLTSSEYVANDGATVILNDSCFGDEIVEIVGYANLPSGIGTGIAGLTIQDEGSTIGTPLSITSINFVGLAVTTSVSGLGVTVSIDDSVLVDTNYWEQTLSGIHTTSNVGIGTTNPTDELTVLGNGNFFGSVTATSFNGNASTSTASNISFGLTGTPDIDVGIVTASSYYVGTSGTVSIGSTGIYTSESVIATKGFVSSASTTPITIELVGNQLTFSAVGIGSTTLTLS